MARIKTIAWQEHVPLQLFDLTEDPTPCEKYRIFSPNLLIVNDKHRLHGPFTKDQVRAMLDGEDTEPAGFSVVQSDVVVRGDLAPITSDSVLSTSSACAGADDEGLCRGKSEWVGRILKENGLAHLGYIHLLDGKCVGGAEFLPSKTVPYPIQDKLQDDAFLTCSYVSDAKTDFRTHPLERLIQDLRAWGFRTLSVAASVDSVFPNGPTTWFEKKGFEDRGVLIKEQMHDAEIRYLQLRL